MPNGTNGDDNLNGTAGNDAFQLYDGNDTAWGGDGDDWASGGNGDDLFIGGSGSDTFWGGAGTDVAYFHTSTAGVKIYLNYDWAVSEHVSDYLYEVENALGSNHDDIIVGDGLGNYLHGMGGNDLVIGGDGYDTLFGGTGADRFHFEAASEAYGDRIEDFKWGEGDRIELANIDAAASRAGDQAFTWRGHTAAPLGEGELGFVMSSDGNTAYVFGNVNGDSTYEVVLTVTGSHLLQSTDFVL